jgi:arginine exporter protein ArgO
MKYLITTCCAVQVLFTCLTTVVVAWAGPASGWISVVLMAVGSVAAIYGAVSAWRHPKQNDSAANVFS